MKNKYPYELQPLPYDYSFLEPHISSTTMKFHHDKHLQTYVNNLNALLADEEELQKLTLEELLCNKEQLPVDKATAISNNAGGVYNHNFFFNSLTSPNSSELKGELKNAVIDAFGSVDAFFEEFGKAAATQFGSGWAWLVLDDNNKLSIIKTANQDTTLQNNLKPLLAIDVWEHAYYLDYQNRRPDYIKEFSNIINWDVVSDRYNGKNI